MIRAQNTFVSRACQVQVSYRPMRDREPAYRQAGGRQRRVVADHLTGA
jgi:hypothetical protein